MRRRCSCRRCTARRAAAGCRPLRPALRARPPGQPDAVLRPGSGRPHAGASGRPGGPAGTRALRPAAGLWRHRARLPASAIRAGPGSGAATSGRAWRAGWSADRGVAPGRLRTCGTAGRSRTARALRPGRPDFDDTDTGEPGGRGRAGTRTTGATGTAETQPRAAGRAPGRAPLLWFSYSGRASLVRGGSWTARQGRRPAAPPVSVPLSTWPRSRTTVLIVLFSFSACLAIVAASS